MQKQNPGELERLAFDRALYAARWTEFNNPFDPDFGFVDYFEAAVARNLSLLDGFVELAEDADKRGILPQPDADQTRLVTDGGESEQTFHEITVRSPFHFDNVSYKAETGEWVIEADERQLENLAETVNNSLNGSGGEYEDRGRGDDFDSELHDDLNSLFEDA